MKNNLSLLLALIGGIFVGMSGIAPDWMHDESLPMMVLCVLILQVGIGVGAMDNLTAMFRSIDIKMLLLPLFTIVGTLLFTLFAFFIFHHESMLDEGREYLIIHPFKRNVKQHQHEQQSPKNFAKTI